MFKYIYLFVTNIFRNKIFILLSQNLNSFGQTESTYIFIQQTHKTIEQYRPKHLQLSAYVCERVYAYKIIHTFNL